jgi:hypothetical protein
MKERTPDADTLDEIDSTLFLSGLVPGSSADSTVSVGPGDNRQRRKGHVGRQLSCFTALRKRLLSSSSPRDERGLQTGPFGTRSASFGRPSEADQPGECRARGGSARIAGPRSEWPR